MIAVFVLLRVGIRVRGLHNVFVIALCSEAIQKMRRHNRWPVLKTATVAELQQLNLLRTLPPDGRGQGEERKN